MARLTSIYGLDIDATYYDQQYPDVAAAHFPPAEHYRMYGWHEGRNPNTYFDTLGYLTTYKDVAAAGIDPLAHFHIYGRYEGRMPSPAFDAQAYLAANPDVAKSGMDPLSHYLRYGRAEGRQVIAEPLVDADGAANAVAEHAATGSGTGVTFSWGGFLSPNLHYTLAGDTSGGGFKVDYNTGVVTVADGSKIDFTGSGASHSYVVTITASDLGHTISQSATIAVGGTNTHAPTFTSTATPSVQENAVQVVTLTTSDPDATGANPPTYTISGGADAGQFTIVNGNQLQFVAPRDYETQAHSYQVQVSANDGANISVQNLTVALTDVNDNAPVFTSSATPSVPENSKAVVTLATTDADTVGINPPTYTISGGADAGKFQIVGGQLQFINAPDYEMPGSAAGSNTYAVQVSANDGANVTIQPLTVTVTNVDEPPVFSSGMTASEPENTDASNVVYRAQATDPEGAPVVYTLSGDDAASFNIDRASGAVTFKASPDYEMPADADRDNVYKIVVTATAGGNASDATNQDVAVTVQNVPGNVRATPDVNSYTEGSNLPVTGNVLGNDSDDDQTPGRSSLSVANAGTYKGTYGTATINTDGTYTYTPTDPSQDPDVARALHSAGSHQDIFNYTAVDPELARGSSTLTVTITDPPPKANPDTYQTNANKTLTISDASQGVLANDTDVENDTLHASLVDQPAHGTLTLNDDGTFTYLPTPRYIGTDRFTYTASDGGQTSNPTTVTISVVDNPPVVTTSNRMLAYTAGQGAVAIDPAVSVSDVDGTNASAATVQITGNYVQGQDVLDGPTHSVTADSNGYYQLTGAGFTDIYERFDVVSGTLIFSVTASDATYQQVLEAVTYTNTSDNPSTAARTVTFTATDEDGLTSQGATDTINVKPANRPPVAKSDNYTTPEDTALTITKASLLSNDTDPDGDTVTITGLTQPSHGVITTDPNGNYVYTPSANYNGSDTFNYTISDPSGATSTTTVTIGVTPVNDPPVANPDNYTTAEGTQLMIPPARGVLINDTDVDGDPLTAVFVSNPAHGTLTPNPDGSFAYTPNDSYSGTDTFTYKANDGQANSNLATVTIHVNGMPTAAAVSGPAVSEAALNQTQGALVTGSQPAAQADTSSGTLSYDFHADGANRTTPFTWSTTVAATSGNAAVSLTSDGAPISWTVEGNGQTLIGTAANSGAYAGDVVAKVELTDVNTGSYKFTLLGPIDHPAANKSGAADQIALNFQYTIKDGNGDTALGSLSIPVRDDAPVAHDFTKTGQSASLVSTNLLLTIDVSDSAAEPSGLTNVSRLELAKAAANELLEQYQSSGNTAVSVVTFSTDAAAADPVWMTVDQAKAFIAGLSAGGDSNYDAALAANQSAFASNGKIAGGENVAYFLSPGEPNAPMNSAGINASEQTAYESFLTNNNIKSYAIGVSVDSPTANLDPIAYDGTTSSQIPSIVVTDLSQLGQTLPATIAPPIIGNLVVDSASTFGADQPGYVKAILINGTTYTYNETNATVTASGGTNHASFDTSTHDLTVSTNLNGIFKVDLDTGSYSYQPADNLNQPITETINFKIADYDGDATAGNTLTLNIADTVRAPIARDDVVFSNESGSTITIPDAALLANDDGHGNSITVSDGPTNVSPGDSVIRQGSQFTFFDGSTDGGSFHYKAAATNSGLNDDAMVTVDRSQAGSTTLEGTGLGEILIGRSTASNTINAYEGDDYLIGGNLNDTLYGGAGNDVLHGLLGNDTMTGGAGQDRFLFDVNDFNRASPQTDTITDYTIGATADSDTLDFRQAFTGLSTSPSAAELGNYLHFAMSGNNTVLQIDTNGVTGGTTVDHTIQFQNTNLFTQTGVSAGSPTANTDLIQHLLVAHNLTIT